MTFRFTFFFLFLMSFYDFSNWPSVKTLGSVGRCGEWITRSMRGTSSGDSEEIRRGPRCQHKTFMMFCVGCFRYAGFCSCFDLPGCQGACQPCHVPQEPQLEAPRTCKPEPAVRSVSKENPKNAHLCCFM